jgi:FKBP-type peptidyl-prolyl cis-trans isomerase 2
MKKMNHILPRLALIPAVVAAVLAVSCQKNVGEGSNVAIKRQFDAWRSIHYPDALEKSGIYVIEDIPGTGAQWNKDLQVTFMTYTIRSLDGTISANTDEQWAKRLGTWNRTYYYGPQVLLTGEGSSYAGMDIMLEGMRQGGTRTAIIPSWMMTRDRHNSVDEYLETETEIPSVIYSITFLDQTEDLAEYELEKMRKYSIMHWAVPDTLSTAPVFFKSFTNFVDEPADMPTDTTVYINYIGRRISDDQVFDTTIADTAKFYHIYDPSRTYEPVSVTWAEEAKNIKMSESSVISGFAYGLHAMHAGEKASFLFGYNLGYGSSGSGNLIPGYAALRFDVEMVPEP